MDLPYHIFLHRNARAEVALDAPWPGTPISGDPHTVTLNGYESEDGKRLMGIWESSPGVRKVDYKDWEYCHFLEGRCILTPERGKPIELKAGDVFVIEPGFKATWEVVEPASREVPSSRASSDRDPARHPPTVLRARVASSFSHRATSSQVLW